MDQSVEMPGAPLYLFPHVVVYFHVEDIGDQIQSILVVLYFCVEACEVKTIRQVVLVDFAKVLIATGGDELILLLAA